MNQPAELSAEGQRTLAALQKAASRALERTARLGQYAVVWRDGRPTILDDSISERDFLRADKAFNERMLAETPANGKAPSCPPVKINSTLFSHAASDRNT